MKQVYVCSDTITGMFSAFYDAWKERRNEEVGIGLKGRLEQQLFCEYTEVQEEERKAIAIERLIQKHLGYNTYWDIYHALLSDDAYKAEAVFHVMQAARTIKNSKKIMEHLSNSDVAKVFELSRRVGNESHQFIEFIRFRELENGVLFSDINPKNKVLTCLGDHFTDRFPLENWLIYDKMHRECIVHRARYTWVLFQDFELNIEMTENISPKEREFEQLWKKFFKSISIKERENPTCQRNHLPLRFRPEMTEFVKVDVL
ncbi:TIGR03915 family putative DNA repair protein [Mediterraneibacter agrestimuris]|uniref:TIGR03915 family putative DNA repair protein n=1 Tax=Mediterraneibacter agrestimuris TaxID=2941333 RepID=UPI00203B65CA|nr:TIGR03915 family putative DNA repair protein [Mediterraneibacter agrestimuris]